MYRYFYTLHVRIPSPMCKYKNGFDPIAANSVLHENTLV